MICIPIIGRTEDEMLRQMAQAAPLADALELRMDYAAGANLANLLQHRPRPVIVTHRPEREGGLYAGPEDQRIALLQRAIDLGAEYVDVELDSAHMLRRRGDTRLIVSRHDFERTPENLEELHRELVEAGADIAKIACMAMDIRDNLRIFDLLRRAKLPTIALCMGELGLISRILGRKFGNFLTFASMGSGQESAPGQIGAADLGNLYRYKKIGPATAVYGVIADPVAHSMSPAIHNAAFEELGLDAVYLPLRVQGDPAAFVRDFQALDVQGYSVTLPHKQAIIAAMDEVDDVVRATGAMNTVVNRAGRFLGTNTDVPAAMLALEEALGGEGALRGKRVLVVGAGGAGRAVAWGLMRRGADVAIANRTHPRAVELARELNCHCTPMEDIAGSNADALVNTTSVGMHPNVQETPVPASVLRAGMLVFDAVYNPPETRLLREARACGCRTVGGIAWFVHQAALQFELWTGRPAPRDLMERVIRARLGN